jgi:hypothetical protein
LALYELVDCIFWLLLFFLFSAFELEGNVIDKDWLFGGVIQFALLFEHFSSCQSFWLGVFLVF